MSAFTIISSVTLFSLVLAGILIAVRSSYLPASVRNPRLGWIALGCYCVAVVAALLVWGHDAEGVGIASGLLGMPWSFVAAFGLSLIASHYPETITPVWQVLVQSLFLVTVLINFRVVYVLGARIPALWTPSTRTPRQPV